MVAKRGILYAVGVLALLGLATVLFMTVPNMVAAMAANRNVAPPAHSPEVIEVGSAEEMPCTAHYITNDVENQCLCREIRVEIENCAYKRPPLNSAVHFIEDGQTLTEISYIYGVSVDEIANYNQIRDPNLIFRHSTLIIPGRGE